MIIKGSKALGQETCDDGDKAVGDDVWPSGLVRFPGCRIENGWNSHDDKKQTDDDREFNDVEFLFVPFRDFIFDKFGEENAHKEKEDGWDIDKKPDWVSVDDADHAVDEVASHHHAPETAVIKRISLNETAGAAQKNSDYKSDIRMGLYVFRFFVFHVAKYITETTYLQSKF